LLAVLDHLVVAGATLAQAIEYVSFQAAWLRSCETGTWEHVLPIGE